jgi:aryl-alcohol dehydrogenase-like predicted oxidoreductase
MTIEKRSFGRTGHMSSAVIFGSAALKAVDQGVADRVLDLLFEHGVNHIDTAPSYGDAELRIGPWMDRHRDAFFLATKTDQWSFEGAKAQIRRSLERLRTDHVDLMQLHALTHPDQWEQALSPGGALDAVLQARAEGLVRFIGVTGHGWTVAAMHRRSLERFDFDSILMPWNWFCAHHQTYAADFEATVALCEQRNVAVQTIKALARGPWAAGAARNRT